MFEKYAYEFKELIDFYPPNEITYNSISKNIDHVSPFVGAGLSAFAYPTWQKLFSNIVEILPNGKYKSDVEKAVKEDDFFKAGDLVFKCLQAPTFLSLIQDVFDPQKIQDDELRQEAVCVIPELFQGMCFTTNFDKVLEKAYQICNKTYYMATPKDEKLISDAIKDNKNVIFKIHGDIGSAPEQIVLTGESYEKNYSPESSLCEQLSLCMRARKLIFLGASLKKDRTLDMLKKYIIYGDVNYAVVGVDNVSQIEKRNEELADLGISAIFYPINSKLEHIWVKSILEWLRDGFCPKNSNVLNRIIKTDRYYKYSCEHKATPYIFPENVFEKIMSFFNNEEPFSWWEAAGIGGVGKSRFAMEIEDIASKENWKVRKFEITNFSNIYLDTNQMEKNSLYIFDDADYYNVLTYSKSVSNQSINIKKFIKWLNWLIKKCSTNNKLRIIFLFNSCLTLLSNSSEFLWWRGATEFSNPMSINLYDDNFLSLDISEDTLLEILKSYSLEKYHSALPENVLSEIKLWLSNVDDDTLKIPLVCMLCVDAYFSEESVEDFKESVYQRVTKVEYFRVSASLRVNIDEYIKNIQSISEIFYDHGHINDDLLHSDGDSFLDSHVINSLDDTEKSNVDNDKLVSLFIKQSYEYLIYRAQSMNNYTMPIRVNYILDEFSSLPAIKDFPSMITAARSRNIRFNLIVQSKHQLKQKYGDESETILSNCNNWVFITSRELELLEEISTLCGVKSSGNKPLLSISALQHFSKEKGEILVLSGRLKPFKSCLPDITRYDDDTFEILPFTKRSVDQNSMSQISFSCRQIKTNCKEYLEKQTCKNNDNIFSSDIQKELEAKFDELFGNDDED